MKMDNLDKVREDKLKLAKALGDALAGDDQKAVEAAMVAFGDYIMQCVMQEQKGLMTALDTSVLAGRGVHTLTSKETEYYNKVIEAMKTNNPKMALQDLNIVMPDTVIERVFEDLTVAHPLLKAIDFANTASVVEWIFNAHETQLAQWGELTDEIVKEIVSAFRNMKMDLYKLSAFIPVANAMLDLGPQWLDRYVRVILAEALALALEEAIINGTGKNMPIGMNRDVSDSVVITGGVYPLRAVVELKSFDPVSYGAFVADNLAKTDKGNPRVIGELLLIVSPDDYLRKIMPATTVRTPQGTYVNDVLPLPTRIVQSTRMETGKAIIGIANRYFIGIGAGTDGGKLEYSDEYRFLEDQRVYRIKLYGNGRALDDVSFVYTDISELEPLVQQVYVTNAGDIGAGFPGV